MTTTPHGLPEDSDGPASGELLRRWQEEGYRPVRRWPRPWPWPLALSALTTVVSTTVLISSNSTEDPTRSVRASLFGLVISVGAMLLIVLFAAVTPARPVDLVSGMRLEASNPSQAAGDDSVGMLVRRAAVHHAYVTAACWGLALLVLCWNAALLLETVLSAQAVDRLFIATFLLGVLTVLGLVARPVQWRLDAELAALGVPKGPRTRHEDAVWRLVWVVRDPKDPRLLVHVTNLVGTVNVSWRGGRVKPSTRMGGDSGRSRNSRRNAVLPPGGRRPGLGEADTAGSCGTPGFWQVRRRKLQ